MDQAMEGVPHIAIVAILLAILDDNKEDDILEEKQKVEEVVLGAFMAKREHDANNMYLP
jgi:hypothetical protein